MMGMPNEISKQLQIQNIGFTHVFLFFHALTFPGSRGSSLNTRPVDRMFKYHLGDRNESSMCDMQEYVFYKNSAGADEMLHKFLASAALVPSCWHQ